MTVLWLPLAILSYIFQAANGVIDRIIVHREVSRPLLISFWVAIFSFTTLLLPLLGLLPTPAAATLRFVTPPLIVGALALFAGIILQVGLYALYRALHDEEATRVLSILGAATPIFTLLLAQFLLIENLSTMDLAAFGVLIVGALALTQNPRGARGQAIIATVIAAGLLAVQTVLAKVLFGLHHFVSIFALMGLGGGLYAIIILLGSRYVRQQLRQTAARSRSTQQSRRQRRQILWIIGNSLLGGVSLISIYLALKLGPPSLINSLRGVQYAAVFLFALALGQRHPQLLDEELSGQSLRRKILGIGLIAVGIVMIALEL